MNRRVVLVIVVAAALLLLGAATIPFGIPQTRDVNNYGTVTVHALVIGEIGPAISTGDTITAVTGVGLAVVWQPSPDHGGELTCQLYSAGAWYEDGVWTLDNTGDHRWSFTLNSVPQGTTDFYCVFGGMYTDEISWVGSTIHFNVASDTPPVYDPVEFTVVPEPEPVAGGESLQLRWWFIYEGPATATVYVDDIEVSSREITPSPTAQMFTYSFEEDTEGNYTVKLTITPEYGFEVCSSCEVTVTSTATTTTATTTTTTTETGTTTTTPPPDKEVEAEIPLVYILIGVIVVVAIVVKAAR